MYNLEIIKNKVALDELTIPEILTVLKNLGIKPESENYLDLKRAINKI